MTIPTCQIDRVLGARRILRDHLAPTPLRRYASLDALVGAEVYVKHENHNPTGTFKVRGSLHLMHHLVRRGVTGVITYSTGNHGTSVATSARRFGLTATVVVPVGSNPLKVRAIRDAGAELIEHGPDFEAAGRRVHELVEERGLYFVHPANEPDIIHGVATEFCEILEDVPDLDVLLVPLGGGSEVAAAITVVRALRPQVDVIAVQAEAAPAAWESWKAGRILEAPNTTFAGGIATGRAYELPFSLFGDGLADFLLLSEAELYEGIALAAHHTRNMVEGAGGACLRAAVKIKDRLRGKKVAIQMSGGNASAEELRRACALPCLETGEVDTRRPK